MCILFILLYILGFVRGGVFARDIDNSDWDTMSNHTTRIECYYLGLFCDDPRKLYNQSYSMETNPNINVNIPNPPINYTELGIFISGLILSVGGFCSLMLGNCRKSNCSSIKCGCIKIERNNLEIAEV